MTNDDTSNEELVHWEPVSNLEDTENENDPYQYCDEKIREYHKNYVKYWLRDKLKFCKD